MACCSGPAQTRKLRLVLTFRPKQDRQFQLVINCFGKDGTWTGKGSNTFEFGSKTSFRCGCSPNVGEQRVVVKATITCSEAEDASGAYFGTIQAVIQTTVGKHTHKGTLAPTTLNCIGGGPRCTAVWNNIFIGQLGPAAISVTGNSNVNAAEARFSSAAASTNDPLESSRFRPRKVTKEQKELRKKRQARRLKFIQRHQ